MTDDASRAEAAVAGVHHEAAEAAEGIEPREHVSATDVVQTAHPHLHHPEDPNIGVVRGRLGRGAALAGALAAAVTVVGVVLLAIALGGS